VEEKGFPEIMDLVMIGSRKRGIQVCLSERDTMWWKTRLLVGV
jgi:hypothetical protein